MPKPIIALLFAVVFAAGVKIWIGATYGVLPAVGLVTLVAVLVRPFFGRSIK